MEPQILIKNLSHAKAGNTERFPSATQSELSIGRDPSCDIKFDPNDDLVSRRHAKITRVSDAPEYIIADLGSRNGTLVNKKRIFEPVRLNCGDVVQLGPGGPEFEFDLDPRPASAIKATRLAETPPIPLTMAATRQTPVTAASTTPPTASSSGTVGKATVERMIGETKRQGRTMTYLVAAALLVVVAAAAAGLYLTRPNSTTTVINKTVAPGGLTPTQIAQANTESTVLIEVGWKLIDTESGKQLYHATIPNEQKDKSEIVPGAGDYLPVFLDYNGKYEPLLTTSDGGGKFQPIGGQHSGSGFVVSNDGFILTNRHVGAAWFAKYDFPSPAGVVFEKGADGLVRKPILARDFPDWVPNSAKFITANFRDLQRLPDVVPKGKDLEGRNDYLDVTFAKNRIRIPAKLARTSDRNDVAMIKIDIPQSLKKVELNDNYDTVKVGDPVVTLGYPGVSAAVLGVVASRDILNQAATVKEIPDPTLSSGNIGRVMRGTNGLEEQEVFNGDYYQLTINSTGAGNSGGPVFDDQGRVIALFTLGIHRDVNISGAVPIRYGLELMGVSPMQSK